MIAGITTDQLISINPGVAKDKVAEGSTILIPANKLSPRDKEIVDGMGTTYRLYPVRSGETLSVRCCAYSAQVQLAQLMQQQGCMGYAYAYVHN